MISDRTDAESTQPARTNTYWSRFTGGSRRRVATLVAVVLLLAAGGMPAAVAQDDGGAPSVPAAYYGDVTVNGDPAPAGTEIVALVDGEEHGSIEVSEAGTYGGPDALDEKLVVEGAESGDEVSFAVRGVTAEETVTWESGDVSEVDLTFEDVPEDSGGSEDGSEDGSNGGAGSGGGGGGGGAVPGDTTDTPDGEQVTPESTNGTDQGTTETDVLRETTANVTVDADTNRARASFDADASVTEIEFETDAVSGSVTISELSAPPEETGAPPGESVTVADIQVPDDAAEQSATVRMRVDADRLEDIGATAEALRVHRFSNGEWQALDTRVVEAGSEAIFLEADTPGFSYFAVSSAAEPNTDGTDTVGGTDSAPEASDGSGDSASVETDGSTPLGAEGDGNDGGGDADEPQREMFGTVPPLWLFGAVVLTLAGGAAIAVVRRGGGSSPERL